METAMLMILMASALLVLAIIVGVLVIHLLHKSDELKEKNDVIVREVRRNQALIDRAVNRAAMIPVIALLCMLAQTFGR